MPCIPPGTYLWFVHFLLFIGTPCSLKGNLLIPSFIYVYLPCLSYFSLTTYYEGIDFKISSKFSLGNLSLYICAKKGLYLFPCTCFMRLCSFFNNCFTRVNRRLVNSFLCDNRIFWSRENVIMKFKNKQTRTKRFRLYISCKNSEFWNSSVCFYNEWGVTAKMKHTLKT